MSSGEDRKSPHEIVIVRRRGGGHGDGHHGGAWKIAFADFMTALMCFFLVMWLINSTDKKTITQIATYFNPLRLNDRLPTQKGLADPQEQGETGGGKPAEKQKSKSKSSGAAAPKADQAKEKNAKTESTAADARTEAERELFRDPYGVLERIAGGEAKSGEREERRDAAKRAEMPRDLFDGRPPAPTPEKLTGVGTSAHSADTRANRGPGEPGSKPAGNKDQPSPEIAPISKKAARVFLEREIGEAMMRLAPHARPRVEVSERDQELLLSLTDEHGFGMFAVGSARPAREVVILVEHIARALSKLPGGVTIRGHTDGRQYKSGDYDNWRLSSARAQIVYYMLLRGGLNEARVRRIEGHADRSLRDAGDPNAPQNRRIDILVGKGSP